MPRYSTYYNDPAQLQEMADRVTSIAGMCRELGIKPVGSNYLTVKRKLQIHSIKTDHWLGQAWGQGVQLKDWTSYIRPASLKRHLMRDRGHQCQECRLTEWMSKPIPLELEHVDGDRTNNTRENLKLLCPNCHALTPTWRRQKSSLVPKVGVEPTVEV